MSLACDESKKENKLLKKENAEIKKENTEIKEDVAKNKSNTWSWNSMTLDRFSLGFYYRSPIYSLKW